MIALDAAEPRLIERWTEDGSLPHLKALCETGGYGRLASSADWLVGSPWPTFYTSTTPADHGLYHYLAWRPERMASQRPTSDYLPVRPFWRELSRAGPRVIAVDIPLTYAPDPFEGVEIAGWGTHETLAGPAGYPPDIMEWARRRFGPPVRTEEPYMQLPLRRLLEQRDEQRLVTQRVLALTLGLMEKEVWDLCLVGFTAAHRGGHKLWSGAGASEEGTPRERGELSDALRQVYIELDHAVGRLVERAGSGARILVFSVHGMGPNTCRTELLGEMLERILSGRRPAETEVTPRGHGRLTERLRRLMPVRWRHEVKQRLPLALQDRLTAFWRLGTVDWEKTRAVSLVADLQGYIRINLRGREVEGIVEPGAEYDDLCAEIADGLRTFADADTGKPVVADIIRTDHLYAEGQRRALLPDLLVQWSETPADEHRAIASARWGLIPWPTPGKNFTGRSGNHRPQGFLIATGEPFTPGQRIEGAHILDLAPTVYELFGLRPPPEMRGRSLAPRPGRARMPIPTR